ncbi:uncharacterized protein METZ01_LOCUS34045 [marine metagenome]|uniref:Uncharacterized protein n=1 Tax=marine metagenome TaxID=408172 RepID=A0A381QPA4_9ZZZZ
MINTQQGGDRWVEADDALRNSLLGSVVVGAALPADPPGRSLLPVRPMRACWGTSRERLSIVPLGVSGETALLFTAHIHMLG